MRNILSLVSADPAALRWLHAHDPDRDVSEELLLSSATYITMAEPDSTPLSSSLFVPMYRRNNFVLGQLYGPMSPNTQALALLSRAGHGPQPRPLTRRFVVNLSSPDTLEFIEYEWLSDGKLCVSMHSVSETGNYDGESVILDAPDPPSSGSSGSSSSKSFGAQPSKVLMRMTFDEALDCALCSGRDVECSCPPLFRMRLRDSPRGGTQSWEHWISSFMDSRRGRSTVTLRFSVRTPHGPMDDSRQVRVLGMCTSADVKLRNSPGNLLARMFLTECLPSDPYTDGEVVRLAERASLREIADQYDDSIRDEEELRRQEDAADLQTAGTESAQLSWSPEPGTVIGDTIGSTPMTNSEDLIRETSELLLGSGGSAAHRPAVPLKVSSPVGGGNEAANGKPVSIRDRLETPKSGRSLSRVSKTKVLVCGCGRQWSHRGHYNAHIRNVHEKVREHQCGYPNCQRSVFVLSSSQRTTVYLSTISQFLRLCFRFYFFHLLLVAECICARSRGLQPVFQEVRPRPAYASQA